MSYASQGFPAPVVAANRLGPSSPDMSLLEMAAPRRIWEKAISQAGRSPFNRYRTGSVLFDPRSERILSAACATPIAGKLHAVASLHAEATAVSRAKHVELEGSQAVIVCISAKSGGWAWSACPCHSCARQMMGVGVEQVHFAQRDDLGVWHAMSYSPHELIERSAKPTGKEARLQRIWVPVGS